MLLKDELTHVHNFVAIQLIRFEHAFQYEEQVPEELLERKVLKTDSAAFGGERPLSRTAPLQRRQQDRPLRTEAG